MGVKAAGRVVVALALLSGCASNGARGAAEAVASGSSLAVVVSSGLPSVAQDAPPPAPVAGSIVTSLPTPPATMAPAPSTTAEATPTLVSPSVLYSEPFGAVVELKVGETVLLDPGTDWLPLTIDGSVLRVVAQQQKERRRKLTRNAAVAAVVVGVVAAIAIPVAMNSSHTTKPVAAIAGMQTFTGLARTHTTQPVTYSQNPPVGGPHSPQWLTCGVYTTPVPNENAVHDLEHGAVWITYQPSLPADQVAIIQADALAPPVVRGTRYVTVSPYPGLPSPVVASAWGTQLKLTSASDSRLSAFIARYRLGPQTPEPGASCAGGIGTPAR
jgi:hypothetical protein